MVAVPTVPAAPKVALLVTCLVNLVRPRVAEAAVQLLQQAGCTVSIAKTQTCCGQPNLNSGDTTSAQAMARHMLKSLGPCDYVVAPSGSCLATVKVDYPRLLQQDPAYELAQETAAKSWELLSFLQEICNWHPVGVRCEGKAAYHDSCSGLRSLGVRSQPRALLSHVAGLQVVDIAEPEACCGFGGTFCVKYNEISLAIADAKINQVRMTSADMLLGGDLGCLLHLAGRLQHQGSPMRVFHAAEVLAGMAQGSGLG